MLQLNRSVRFDQLTSFELNEGDEYELRNGTPVDGATILLQNLSGERTRLLNALSPIIHVSSDASRPTSEKREESRQAKASNLYVDRVRTSPTERLRGLLVSAFSANQSCFAPVLTLDILAKRQGTSAAPHWTSFLSGSKGGSASVLVCMLGDPFIFGQSCGWATFYRLPLQHVKHKAQKLFSVFGVNFFLKSRFPVSERSGRRNRDTGSKFTFE
jgi:hypothetical protein